MPEKILQFNDHDIHITADTAHTYTLPQDDIISGYDITSLQLEDILHKNSNYLNEGKHYLNNPLRWTKKGALKLAFFISNDVALNFVDFVENIVLESPQSQEKKSKREKLIELYKAIEEKFVQYANKIKKEESADPKEMQQYFDLFNQFVSMQKQLEEETAPTDNDTNRVQSEFVETAHQDASQEQKRSGFLQTVYNLATSTGKDAYNFASDTRDTAYKFASKTEDDAFKFTSKTEDDAFKFTENTRDKAYDFASKTEDDAFKFASKMEDDAYHFVTKMADDAYQFASKGMDYGYMFTTQGEELGPMADRILWMAGQIGQMADRIGEMADRIVHTEHLIINMSVNILNFGLLIDGTIKTIAESGLQAMGMLLDKEVKPLTSSNRHLDLINDNIQTILKQQHEYDMKVLENQKELRTKTQDALDKIKYEY
jgi:hypothetical protein